MSENKNVEAKSTGKNKNVEAERAAELQDDFNLEFEKALDLLCSMYPRVSRVKKYNDLTSIGKSIGLFSFLLANLFIPFSIRLPNPYKKNKKLPSFIALFILDNS